MHDVLVAKVEILESNEVLVTPVPTETCTPELFRFIYRMATGVYWSEEKESFSSPVPREWSQFQWFENIAHCAESELGIRLVIHPGTRWANVSADLKEQLENDARFAP